MAAFLKIVTLAGGIVSIAAESVWRIAHAVPDDAGTAHTQIDYDGGLQLTDEPPAKLVADLTAAGVKMITLTAPDQSTIYLNAADVTATEQRSQVSTHRAQIPRSSWQAIGRQ